MTNKRNIYLQMKPVKEARRLFFDRIAFDTLLGQEPLNRSLPGFLHPPIMWPQWME
ncbi:MAG: hypothetical protein JRF24_11080 [Deltaproteobacteria bacterium]|nr:hypothetical protein [Deltaproteobacteria bacterium]